MCTLGECDEVIIVDNKPSGAENMEDNPSYTKRKG